MKARIVDFLEQNFNQFEADRLAHHRRHQMTPYLAKLGFWAFQQLLVFESQKVGAESVQNYSLNSVRKESTHSDNYQDLELNQN